MVTRPPDAERLERLSAHAVAVDTVPVGRASVHAQWIQVIVAGQSDSIVNQVDEPTREHRLAGSGESGDSDGDASELITRRVDRVDDVGDVAHASLAMT